MPVLLADSPIFVSLKLFVFSYLVSAPERGVLGGSRCLSPLCSRELSALWHLFIYLFLSSSSDLCLSRILSAESFYEFHGLVFSSHMHVNRDAF